MKNQKAVFLLLRLSIASVFLYAAIASFIEPENWIGYFPVFLRNLLPEKILLTMFSSYEILLSLWILSGWKSFWSAILSALTLVGIIAFNISQLDIIFRDLTIIFASLALAAGS